MSASPEGRAVATVETIRSVVAGEAPVEGWPLDELVEAVGVVQALVGVAPEVLDYRVECRLRALGLPHAPSREEVTDARKP